MMFSHTHDNEHLFVCSNYSVQETIQELQNDKIDVWHISSNTVELCTSLSNYQLKKHYNLHCRVIRKLNDLLKLENMKENNLLRFVFNYACIYVCIFCMEKKCF